MAVRKRKGGSAEKNFNGRRRAVRQKRGRPYGCRAHEARQNREKHWEERGASVKRKNWWERGRWGNRGKLPINKTEICYVEEAKIQPCSLLPMIIMNRAHLPTL
jgi:hypothetical protein